MNTTPPAFPRLETERLILREMKSNDKEDIFQSFSDENVTKYFSMNPFTSVKDSEKIIKRAQDLFEQGKGIQWGIVTKEGSNLIGTCGFETWRKESFEHMGLNRIEATTRSDNTRSINMLYRLGFKMEGILRERVYWEGTFYDQVFVSLLKKEWIQRTFQ